VGQCDYVSVFIASFAPKVRKESEDFGRDLVDWCGRVPPGPNEAENLDCVLFKNIELKDDAYQ